MVEHLSPERADEALSKGIHLRRAYRRVLRSLNNSFVLLALAFLAASWVIVLMRRPQQGSAVDAGAH